MNETKQTWKPGGKDAIFLGVVILVIGLLVLGTGKRTTKPTPNDTVHQHALKREACMQCHGATGVRPRPVEHHVKGDQCFQCHTQPAGWLGVNK